jgi:chromosome segregation ATPase
MGRRSDAATKRLTEATEQVAEWKRREQELASELEAAEANVGAEALESGDLESAAARVANLRDRFEAARSTIAAAEAARSVAQREAWRAEAGSRRAESDRLEKQAEKHAARTSELLDALEEHEGGRYVPEQPQVGVASSLRPWTPRTEQLRSHAAAERKAADDLERRAARVNARTTQRIAPVER